MRKLLLASTLTLIAGAAHAEDISDSLGLYAGAGIMRAKTEQTFNTDFDDSNTSWKVFAGLHPSGFPLGVDVDYVNWKPGCRDVLRTGFRERQGVRRLRCGLPADSGAGHRPLR